MLILYLIFYFFRNICIIYDNATRGEYDLPGLFELIEDWQSFALSYDDQFMMELLEPIYEVLNNVANASN